MTLPDIRALTIKQPWGCAVASGAKDVENRVWSTKYRGLIAIHAGLAYDRRQDTSQWVLAAAAYATADSELTEYSAVLGVARIADCHPWRPGCCDSPWGEQGLDIWHWVLTDVQPFTKPIPNVRGALRLWTPGDDLLGEIQHAMEAGR